MRRLTIILCLLIMVSCKSDYKIIEVPTDYSIVIKRGSVTGVLFKENGTCLLCLQNKKRFTPTIEEIEKAELILEKNLKSINQTGVNQFNNCPLIHKNLNSYRRQYFGYIDNNGDKIIYTTFNWDRFTLIDRLRGSSKDENENWKKEKEIVMDGCSYHWEIKINLDKEELFELGINGIAKMDKNNNYYQQNHGLAQLYVKCV